MHILDFNEVAKHLEPDARAGGDGSERALISIAVSAKRIADSLEIIALASALRTEGEVFESGSSEALDQAIVRAGKAFGGLTR